jgi:hypothetical protein
VQADRGVGQIGGSIDADWLRRAAVHRKAVSIRVYVLASRSCGYAKHAHDRRRLGTDDRER